MPLHPPTVRDPLEVVGAAVVRAGRCLAAQRGPAMSLAGKWELPGGKVDPGEAPVAALEREVREELGIEIEVGARLGAGEAEDGGRRIRLTAYLATWRRGEIELREHGACGWFTPAELLLLDWAEADVAVLPALLRHLGGAEPALGTASPEEGRQAPS